ncbi:MAG TPA: hypothetical protein VGY66_27885 [Gemmataceae bacterium]|jgi:hypothetical protein|nr:hypothetical protein [Gemmataceae bacterium]
MTAAPALAFPSSKTLLSWWTQLAPLRPSALWVGHLLLHRVEALVSAQRPCPIDPIALFVLRAVALAGQASLETVALNLALERALVRQALARLQLDKLVEEEAGGVWRPLKRGAEAVQKGLYLRGEQQRRAFYFVESALAADLPVFIPLQNHPSLTDWPGNDVCRFQKTVLQECLQQPAEWKVHRGFPLDVTDIVDENAAAGAGSPPQEIWRAITVVQPRHLLALLVLVRSAAQEEKLLGFAVQQQRWLLEAEQPAFEVKQAWRELVPEAIAEPPLDMWRQSWRDWCRARGLPEAEVDACTLEQRHCTLHVTAGSGLLDRLQASHDVSLKGEAWLLCGAERIRKAVRLEIARPRQGQLRGR